MTDIANKDAVAALLTLLDVETIEPDLYRGARHPGGKGRVFGGQVIGQALVAAARSAPDNPAHSLHAYFMRPGDEDLPIDYRVLRDFDGASFATRRVVALQNDKPILNLSASFQRLESGLEHGAPMPVAPRPEDLPVGDRTGGGSPAMRHFLARFDAFEFRPVPPFGEFAPPAQPGPSQLWFRLAATSAPTDPVLRSALLAYLSDFGLLTTAVLPHGIPLFSGRLQVASLDHALWLHEVAAFDEWLLYTMESPWAGAGRGLTRGTFHTASGRHIATVMQEGLIRPIVPRAA